MRKVVLYIHEGEEKIVSKHCPKCGELKLTEDFAKTSIKGMLTSLCTDCLDEKKREEREEIKALLKQKEQEKPNIEVVFQDLEEMLKKYESTVGGNK